MEEKKHLKRVLFRRKLFAKLAVKATMCVQNLLKNNLAIKRRRKEELSKIITKLPCELDISKK